MESETLRKAFSQFVTGVTIVSIKHAGRAYGITVNSFTSLSLDPPLLLWCLARDGEHQASYELFKDAPSFFVSILDASQAELSRTIAKHNNHELTQDKLSEGLFIKNALVGFECSVDKKIEAGDHIIIIAAIKECKIFDENKKPLIFYQKQYRTLE